VATKSPPSQKFLSSFLLRHSKVPLSPRHLLPSSYLKQSVQAQTLTRSTDLANFVPGRESFEVDATASDAAH